MVASAGMLMVLLIAPEMNGWAAAIIWMWASTAMKRWPFRPQRLAQSKTAQVLGPQMRRALDRHGAAAVVVGGLDLAGREAERAEQVAVPLRELRLVEAEAAGHVAVAERPLVEGELDVERAGERGLDAVQALLVEALGAERVVVDDGRAGERLPSHAVGDDVVDLARRVAELAKRHRQALVDDLEVAAARQLLELDQREVGLDAGRVAVHDEADGAGGREHRDLGVAVAVDLAERERAVPRLARGLGQGRRAVRGSMPSGVIVSPSYSPAGAL